MRRARVRSVHNKIRKINGAGVLDGAKHNSYTRVSGSTHLAKIENYSLLFFIFEKRCNMPFFVAYRKSLKIHAAIVIIPGLIVAKANADILR